ncbi:MAG: DUF554 domain-containing protein [Deltaproteobacteria bacterium]|jgi:uncharacterized membrane protein YqgA involved in biofilm formation|nr:DUF554 domain-containing protein [Deltaproteobacteria bacterium]
MIIPVGTLINSGLIVAGSLLGMTLGNRLSPGIRIILFQGIGLCSVVIGLQMAFEAPNIIIVIFSMVIGGVLGELLALEKMLERLGAKLQAVTRSSSASFTQGFVTATMLFCIGTMAILGPLDEGLSGDRSILMTKSIMDGCAAMAFAAALGVGVLFSALPVLIIQGLITIFAVYLQSFITPEIILYIKGAGGILILGIALNVLELAKIRVTNLLPALIFVVLLAPLATLF